MPKSNLRPASPWLAPAAIVVLPAAAIAGALARPHLAGPGSLDVLLALQVVALLVAAAVHEAGHAVAARAAGFRVAGWRVGPVSGFVTPLGWQVRISVGSLAGGVLLPDPVHPDDLRRRHVAVIVAGPAAHLALGAVVAVAAAAAGSAALAVTAATVLLSGVANLVPLTSRPGDRWSDGRWLWTWLRRPDRAAQRVGLGSMQLAMARGVRPRDWDERWASLAGGGPRRPVDRVQVAGCLLAYASALDRGDAALAGSLLTRAFAGRWLSSERGRAALAIEVAFFLARFRGDGRLAARVLEVDVPVATAPLEPDLQRALAAVHLANGRDEAAVAACDRALTAMDATGDRPTGRRMLDRELVLAMRRDAAERAAGTSAAPVPRAAVRAG